MEFCLAIFCVFMVVLAFVCLCLIRDLSIGQDETNDCLDEANVNLERIATALEKIENP